MTVSRSARITLLLVIDIVFFFVELIVGYAVGSLALVADSFHMLNDVMSLIVALLAIKLSAQNAPDSRYTYGWHRAEILAALINGVFLLALCFSIFLEAIERFFSTPEITNPKLVVVVGSLGLASNIVGLFLFHEHDHSHSHTHNVTPSKPSSMHSASSEFVSGDITPRPGVPVPIPSGLPSRSRSASYSSLYGHPAATRASLVQVANSIASHARSSSMSSQRQENVHHYFEDESAASAPSEATNEQTPLLLQPDQPPASYYNRDINQPTSPSGGHRPHTHAHSGSMNMRALMLHVFGDALGNVGVIATGLVIWLSDWKFKYFFDPVISLVITVIIFSSALPLVRSASFILLQGVPANVSMEEVRASILAVEGVHSLHELHIWQLSETKIVASVHVTASRDPDFMLVASKIRNALHDQGIHSSTIQPEYHCHRTALAENRSKRSSCLILCPEGQGCDPAENACCPPPPTDA